MLVKKGLEEEYSCYCRDLRGTYSENAVMFADKLASMLEGLIVGMKQKPEWVIANFAKRACYEVLRVVGMRSSDFALASNILGKYWVYGREYDAWYRRKGFSIDFNPVTIVNK